MTLALMTLALMAMVVPAGCTTGDIERDPPLAITRPKPEPALPENAPPPVETWDHWLHRYHRFMTPEEMREHLALPAGKRLLARRQRLADLEARRVLLDRVRERLDREEIEAFYQLPTYAACEAFVAALPPVPKNAGAAPGEPARGAERSPPG